MDLNRNTTSPVMSKKTILKSHLHDRYCFECHQTGELVRCEACPRGYHPRCLQLFALSDHDWLCPECQVRLSALDRRHHSPDEYHMMFRHTLQQMRSRLQSKNLLRSILVASRPESLQSIIYPMDLETMVKHVNERKYPSAEAFLADVKWIVHNTCICTGIHDVLSCTAQELLDIVAHEITEFQLCSQCYQRNIQSNASDWFAQSCMPPHTLCWAKMKTYQPWPGKVFRIVDDLVDVRFFGQHDRAWIPIKQCFVLSKEYPSTEKKRTTRQFENSLLELQIHIDQLRQHYGTFTYAPPRTTISKTKPFRFVPIIDDSVLPSYMTEPNSSSGFLQRQTRSSTSTRLNRTPPETRMIGKRGSESSDRDLPSKRERFSSIDIEDDLPQPGRSRAIQRDSSLCLVYEGEDFNVFDILKPEDEIVSPTDRRTTSAQCSAALNDPLRIQALLRKYLDRPSVSNERPAPRGGLSTESRTSQSNLFTCSSVDQSLSITLPSIPIRALSMSPPSPLIFESVSLAVNENRRAQESLLPTIKSEPVEYDAQLDMELNTFHQHSTKAKEDARKSARSPTLARVAPRLPTSRSLSPENIWLSALSVESPRDPSASDSSKSILTTIPISPPVPVMNPCLAQTEEHSSQPSLNTSVECLVCDDEEPAVVLSHSPTTDAHAIISDIHNQFQDLLVDFTDQIRSFFERNRLKDGQNLEDTRHSHSLSADDLHTITTKQVEAMHHTLESQCWGRLTDMRQRYDTPFSN